MDVGTRIFWSLVAVLLAAATFFGVGAQNKRTVAQQDAPALKTGDLVRVAQVIDGDSLVVSDEQGARTPVRIVGIKAFAAKSERDAAGRFGKAAVETLEKLTAQEPVRVLLHSTDKDRHGRVLATLYVADEDLGLTLVKRGLVLVYTVYPFPGQTLYLQEQSAAAAEQRGLWAEKEMAERARALMREWGRSAQ